MRSPAMLGVLYSLGVMALTACSTHPPLLATQGTIALVGDEVVKLDAIDVDSVCENHYCEPNYIYEASFGKKKPRPAPLPPGPTPTPTPAPIPEQHDWSRYLLEMSEVWRLTQGSPSVVVAVIDSGVQSNHPDLAGSVGAGYNFVANHSNAADDNGHGTHCAGNIAAQVDGVGIVGIAPQVRIMPLKFLDAQGYGDTAAAISAIRFAADNGAHILSNSWGGGGASQLLDAAIQYARGKGAIVVAAAGNSSMNNDTMPSYPANYEGVVSVASSDERDGMSYFSNYGRTTVTLAAPGSNILAPVQGSAWKTMSGTSMATPIVAGALALARSISPGASSDALVQALCATSRRGFTGQTVCGRIDIRAFVTRVMTGG